MKVYLSPSLQEANPYYGGQGVEATHMRDIANRTAKLLRDAGVTVIMSPVAWVPLGNEALVKVCAASNAAKVDAHVAIHSNAGPKGADGTDTFYLAGSVKGHHLASCLQGPVSVVSPGSDGGIHTANFYELTHTDAPAALIEIAFHTDPRDTASIVKHPDLYARALAQGILAYLHVVPEADIDYRPLKRAARTVAKALAIAVPEGFNAEAQGLGPAARTLLRRISEHDG